MRCVSSTSYSSHTCGHDVVTLHPVEGGLGSDVVRSKSPHTPYIWSPTCEDFHINAFIPAPILHRFGPSLPLVVDTGASDYPITEIFSVHTDDGNVNPIAFFRHMLLEAEINQDVHDRELLAIFQAFKAGHYHLESVAALHY